MLEPLRIALAGPVLCLLGCQPRPLPPATPALPPNKSVMQEDMGTNQARVTYDCGRPHGRNVEGGGTLAAPLRRCHLDAAGRTLTVSSEDRPECQSFLITITDYHGIGTYNTSSLGKLSFGTAKVQQPACRWQGDLCLDWNGPSGPYPDTSCTVEVSAAPRPGQPLRGTFVCSAFAAPFAGCPAKSATAACAVTRGMFSVDRCTMAQPGSSW